MAKEPTKKKVAAKAAPSSSPKTKKLSNGTVTFGKGVTLGKGVK
tara:strand:+ start:548 stop:679 length:132 start_codon:yes stop_codon:yes gene_type:complete